MDYTGQGLDREQDDEPKLPGQPLDTDFAKKFPPDPTLGDEIAETARVWKVYRAEAEAHDATMLDGWNKTLDVLLVFAGLFSAVATAFLIDSYKLLQPDTSAAYMSTALYLLVMRDNISSSIPLPPPPPLATPASTMARAVNWLWFTSLFLALSVALLGILVKQWIVEYNARNAVSAESPIKWAIRRQMYFNGIISWPVSDLVSVLPVMLHASLFLFFTGVALFVWNLDLAIGIWVSLLGLVLGVFYMACSLLPLWVPECPTSTPLVNLLRRSSFAVRIVMLQLCVAVCTRTAQARRGLRLSRSEVASDPQVVSIMPRDNSNDNGQSHTIGLLMSAISSVRARQTRSIANHVPEERVDSLTADGLLWLMFSVADSDARAVGMQALGAVPSCGALAQCLRSDVRLVRVGNTNLYTRSAGGRRPVENARTVRSMLWSRDNSFAPNKKQDTLLGIYVHLSDAGYPDVLFLKAFNHTVSWLLPKDGAKIPPPPQGGQSASISSTVLLFLRARHLDFTDLVTALLWCDFGLFHDADWMFVLERIVSEGSTRTSLLLLPLTSHLVCIGDVLAQCIMRNDAVRNNMMVHQLLATLLQRMAHIHYDQVKFSSFISAYLVSDSFFEQQVQAYDLLILMTTVLFDAWKVAEAYPPAMETYCNLLCNLLPSLLRRQQGEGTAAICAHLSRALRAYNTSDRVRDGQRLSLTRRILMPTEWRPPLSIWDMLRGMQYSGGLAKLLAQTLCMGERNGEDVSAMVDIFLSHLSLQELFDMNKADADFSRRHDFGLATDFLPWVTPLIRDCVDLRPAWWFESLSSLREDECADPELKKYSHELEAIPLYRGICDRCHRLPRGWEDDDNPPSSCGFNPAPPGPSTAPPSMSTPDARTPWSCFLCDE